MVPKVVTPGQTSKGYKCNGMLIWKTRLPKYLQTLYVLESCEYNFSSDFDTHCYADTQ